jgi:uncharacterized tellurite resistance protein B-like protein
MLKAIRTFFEQNIQEETERDSEHALQLATAALLIETIRADFNISASQCQSAVENLRHFFNLEEHETRRLVELAEQEADDKASLFQFTSLIGKHFDSDQKSRVIEMMWRVGLADGDKSMYEEHLIRKIAKLLYVPHSEFVRTRVKIEDELAGGLE